MSLQPDASGSPAPWSTKAPWGPVQHRFVHHHAPGAFPSSPQSEPLQAAVSSSQSMSAAVKARKADYVRKASIKVKVGTWNVASISGTEKDLGAWFVDGLGVKGLSQDLAGLSVESSQNLTNDENVESVEDQEARRAKKKMTLPKNDVPAVPSGDEVGLYVLGLQEVVDVTSVTESIRPYTDPNPAKKWKAAMKQSLPSGYELIAEQQLLGLLILIYAAPDVAHQISSVSATSVGTGLGGYLGNKGAVSVRLVLGQTTRMVFVNCHLAAGADKAALERRIWDTNQILTRTVFAPVSIDGEVAEAEKETIGDEDFGFWFGDLNYRLDDIPGEDVRRLLLLHTRNEYDVANLSKRKIDSELGYIPAPSTENVVNTRYEYNDAERSALESKAEPALDPLSDPASLQTTLQSLFRHDQLRAQQRLQKAFHEGWREGDLNFLPTYKYDVGSVGMFDSGEKKRSPSWCDRILYRTRNDRLDYQERARHDRAARKKDADMKARGLDEAAAEQDVLFDYDPTADGLAYGDDYDEGEDAHLDPPIVHTREGGQDSIELDHYVSHQRVLSSDHKPLDAIFTLTYDAVVPELKAQVHQAVARELDKAENEGRPAVTVVVDYHPQDAEISADGPPEPSDITVHYGEVRYDVTSTRTLTLANTSQVDTTFFFRERPAGGNDQGAVAPSWLQTQVMASESQLEAKKKAGDYLEPSYTLAPGETTSIALTVHVLGQELVQDLNEGKTGLEDVLVLSVVNGRDHFIPIKSTWLPSSFFRTLDELAQQSKGGVRAGSDSDRPVSSENQSPGARHSAPRALYQLTDAIPRQIERATAEWDMLHDDATPPWKQAGSLWPFDPDFWTLESGEDRSALLASIREALDTASNVEESFAPDLPHVVRVEILAETLMAFLGSVQDGIITPSAWSEIEEQLLVVEKSKTTTEYGDVQAIVMEALSNIPVHSVSLTFVVFMLTRILNELVPSPSPGVASPQSSRRARSSTTDSEAPSESSFVSQDQPPSQGSFLSSLRRRRAQRTTSSAAGADMSSGALDRRKALQKSYADIFGRLIIRSGRDSTVRGKDQKMLDSRKGHAIECFLHTPAN